MLGINKQKIKIKTVILNKNLITIPAAPGFVEYRSLMIRDIRIKFFYTRWSINLSLSCFHYYIKIDGVISLKLGIK
jgi:hypothetical protein|tara:strand:- start:2049 stop:2276 length:228 start_codon:yes stop_codon:yes gene_type:complete